MSAAADTVDVYIDFDGVMNVVARQDPEDWGWGPSTSTRDAKVGYNIRYSSLMIDRINALAARPNAEFHWLTTHLEVAPTRIADAIGLKGQDWPVVGRPEWESLTGRRDPWWKWVAFRERFLAVGRRAVWIDDDLYDPHAQQWARPYVESGRLLLVQPRHYRALTTHELASIEAWIGDPS